MQGCHLLPIKSEAQDKTGQISLAVIIFNDNNIPN